MKTAEETLREVQKIDMEYYGTGQIAQFTIDMIEHFIEEINDYISRKRPNSWTVVRGSLAYKVSIVIEICDTKKLDYKILNKLYEIVK